MSVLKSRMNSLYVHIPFCFKKCIYCDFVSGIYDTEKADAYLAALKKELSGLTGRAQLSTLFIGGGTPTALTAEALTDLISHIFRHFQFAENYEATIEANPGTVDMEKLKAIRSSGINRLSIGVQSFNNDDLAFLGRIHSAEEAEQAVGLARDAGFENIGIDLIYGIPGQSIESWMTTLEKAASLKPKHISTYELTVEEGTKLHESLTSPLRRGDQGVCLQSRAESLRLPAEDKIIEMYERTIDYLASQGYAHYEISNFALPGYQCKHNINYWDRGEYYGAGLGAHSFIMGKRFHNTGNLAEYLKAVSENKSTVKETENITEDKALSEALFLGLRKTGGINIESFAKRYRKNILSHYQNELAELLESGLIEIAGSDCSYETSLRLTRKGLLLSNEAFLKFL